MFRISRFGWIWVGFSAVLIVIECLRSEITIIADGALSSIGLIWCAIFLGMILSMRRPPLRALAVSLECLAQLIAVSVICAFLQYPAAKMARPLIDADLAAIDRALYFDWPACFAWVLRHPMALNFLSGVYLSLGLQSALSCFVTWRQPDRASIWLGANTLSLTCCLAIFVVWPAGGAFAYYQPAGIFSDYLEQFEAARSGFLTTLAIGQMRGIIQFPSYHAAAAVLLAYAFASLPRWIAIPAFITEITLGISAVPIGGHHLIDVLSGVAVGATSLGIARAFSKTGLRYRPPAVVVNDPAPRTQNRTNSSRSRAGVFAKSAASSSAEHDMPSAKLCASRMSLSN
jgi:membrane-associated phospholipid phosphatase